MDAKQLAAEASNRAGKKITADQVEELLDYSPEYDHVDLKEVVEALGRTPKRSVEGRVAHLVQLAKKAKAKLRSRRELESQDEEFRGALEAFLNALMPGVKSGLPTGAVSWGVITTTSPDEKPAPDEVYALSPSELRRAMQLHHAREIISSALSEASDSAEAWKKAGDALVAALPDWARRPADGVDHGRVQGAWLVLCEAYKNKLEADVEYLKYWVKAGQIARKMINRARDATRLARELRIEDAVFEHLWFGTPMAARDVEPLPGQTKHRARYLAFQALDDALGKVPPPRSLERLLITAYRLARHRGYAGDRKSFKRLVNRHTSPSRRERLKTEEYRPLILLRGDGTTMAIIGVQRVWCDPEAPDWVRGLAEQSADSLPTQ